MVTIGISDARIERRKNMITSTTSTIASPMVLNTALIERSMNTALSLPMLADKPLRQRLVDLGQHAAHGLGHIERIGDRLLDDADRDRGLAVVAAVAPLVGGAEFDARHLAELDLMAAGDLDDDVAELLGRDESGARQDREFAVAALDAPGRKLDVLRAQRVLDVLDRQIERGQPLAVDPDAHGIAPLAVDRARRRRR